MEPCLFLRALVFEVQTNKLIETNDMAIIKNDTRTILNGE